MGRHWVVLTSSFRTPRRSSGAATAWRVGTRFAFVAAAPTAMHCRVHIKKRIALSRVKPGAMLPPSGEPRGHEGGTPCGGSGLALSLQSSARQHFWRECAEERRRRRHEELVAALPRSAPIRRDRASASRAPISRLCRLPLRFSCSWAWALSLSWRAVRRLATWKRAFLPQSLWPNAQIAAASGPTRARGATGFTSASRRGDRRVVKAPRCEPQREARLRSSVDAVAMAVQSAHAFNVARAGSQLVPCAKARPPSPRSPLFVVGSATAELVPRHRRPRIAARPPNGSGGLLEQLGSLRPRRLCQTSDAGLRPRSAGVSARSPATRPQNSLHA